MDRLPEDRRLRMKSLPREQLELVTFRNEQLNACHVGRHQAMAASRMRLCREPKSPSWISNGPISCSCSVSSSPSAMSLRRLESGTRDCSSMTRHPNDGLASQLYNGLKRRAVGLLTQCARHEGEGGGPPYSDEASFTRVPLRPKCR